MAGEMIFKPKLIAAADAKSQAALIPCGLKVVEHLENLVKDPQHDFRKGFERFQKFPDFKDFTSRLSVGFAVSETTIAKKDHDSEKGPHSKKVEFGPTTYNTIPDYVLIGGSISSNSTNSNGGWVALKKTLDTFATDYTKYNKNIHDAENPNDNANYNPIVSVETVPDFPNNGNEFNLKVVGAGGHGSQPDSCASPIRAANYIVKRLQNDPVWGQAVTITNFLTDHAIRASIGGEQVPTEDLKFVKSGPAGEHTFTFGGTIRIVRPELRDKFEGRVFMKNPFCKLHYNVFPSVILTLMPIGIEYRFTCEFFSRFKGPVKKVIQDTIDQCRKDNPGTSIRMDFGDWINCYPVLDNHEEQAALVAKVGKNLNKNMPGTGFDYLDLQVSEDGLPIQGAEDFAFYNKEVKGCFFFLGTKEPLESSLAAWAPTNAMQADGGGPQEPRMRSNCICHNSGYLFFGDFHPSFFLEKHGMYATTLDAYLVFTYRALRTLRNL